jgi:hypothetical protein
VLVKEDNLPGHYAKVHPRRANSLTKAEPIPKSKRHTSSLFKHRRKIIVGIFLAAAIGGIIVAAADYANMNTVRENFRVQISARIYDANYTIPKDIGINSQLWRNHILDHFGVHGMSPIHTRDASGNVQVESNTVRNYYFHDFLAVWGQTVNSENVLGTPVGSDFARLIINHQVSPITENPLLVDGEIIQIFLATSSPG